jgi:hypothetical protein
MSVANIEVTLIREWASLVRVITLGRSKVNIEWHLALDRADIRALALEWSYYDEDEADEAEQAILVVMWLFVMKRGARCC